MDPGLSQRELLAIRRALLVEDDPGHLIGFASCLSPYFPVSASFLYAKSKLLKLREEKTQRDLAANGHATLEALSRLIDSESQGAWSGSRAAAWILQPIDTAGNLESATMRASGNAWTDAASIWRYVSPPVVAWPKLDRMRSALEGLDAFKGYGGRARQIGRALCQPSESSSLESSLQTSGFHELYPLTRGASLEGRADDLMSAERRAVQNGTDTRSELLARRRSEVPRELRYEASKLAGELVINPDASELETPTPAAKLARAAVTEVGPGIWIVDPRFHTPLPGAEPLARRSDWAELARERARWIDWHSRASHAG